jgi:hypothetical protein
LAVVVSNRDLLVQAVWSSAMNAGNGLVGAVFVLFALENLHLNGTAYGALLTAGGIGGVLGAAVAGAVARRRSFHAGRHDRCRPVDAPGTRSPRGRSRGVVVTLWTA